MSEIDFHSTSVAADGDARVTLPKARESTWPQPAAS